MITLYLAPLTSGLVALLILKWLLNKQISQALLDIPNERSSHTKPRPKIGGIAIMVGVLLGSVWLYKTIPWLIILVAIALAILSLVDDKQELPVFYRLLAHLIASILLILNEPPFNNWLIIFISMIIVVWLINLYNFMDGLDGLAGGMTCLGFGTYALASYLGGNINFAFLGLVIVTATCAFLIFNFPPAKVFMGDTGSIPLGFLAAAFGLYGHNNNLWPWWFPLMVFSPFIFDATLTLLKRFARKEKIWIAHKEHYYQKLAQKGWGHLYTTLFAYVIIIMGCILALWLLYQSFMVQLVGIAAWLAALTITVKPLE